MLQMQKELVGEDETDKGFKLSEKYKFDKKPINQRGSESEEELKEGN
jgi:hypothetical protein